MILASTAEDWGNWVSFAVVVDENVSSEFIVVDLVVARFILETKLGCILIALGVGSMEIIVFLVTERGAIMDGDTAINILLEDE